jgi:hypothetical protein
MILANNNVIALSIATGKLPLITPYISQKSVPKVKRPYIDNEMPDVFFDWIVLIACGKKDTVVPNAAKYPIIAVTFI